MATKTAKRSTQSRKTAKRAPKRANANVGASVERTWVDAVTAQLGRDIWPEERNILFKPDRLKYVRRLVAPEECVFCSAHKKGVSFDSLVVGENHTAMVVMNKYPYNNGHLLVLPKRHTGDLLDLTDTETKDVQAHIRRSVHALKEVYAPAGFNIGLNLGSVAGAGIPDHLHWHLIPRWSGDTNFFPLIAQSKVVVETLERTYERLLPYFRG